MISIICPIYNEEKYIEKCIESILLQDFPKEDMEVLFVDGMSTDRTRELVRAYSEQHPFIHLLDNPDKIVPVALNIGIRVAKGDIIIRLDAHAEYPNNYFSILTERLNALGADNVGGVCRTLPVNDTPVCQAIAFALSSPFGMGNSYFRIGAPREMPVDTVPFGCFRKTIFEKIGMFDEDLVRNQDDEFNGRIIRDGGKIYLIPSVVINYYARDTIGKVSKMFYQYGLFKPLVNKKLGKPATLRQFFPPGFVLGLLIGGILACLHPIFLAIYLIVLALYLIADLLFSLKSTRNPKIVPILMAVFPVIHVSYGWGYLVGIGKILLNKSFSVKTNR